MKKTIREQAAGNGIRATGTLRRFAAAAGLAALIGFGAAVTAAEASATPAGHATVASSGTIGVESGEGPNQCPVPQSRTCTGPSSM